MYFVRPVFLILLGAILLADVALTFVVPHGIAYADLWPTAKLGLLFAVLWLCFRLIARSCKERSPAVAAIARCLAVPAEGMTLVILMVLGMRVMDYLTKGTALPLADDWLSKVGPMLGFDWRAYFDFVRTRPALQEVLSTAYIYLNTAIMAFILALALTRQHARVRLFAEAVILCAIGSLIGGALFPAIGAAAWWIPDYADPASHAGYPFMPGVYFVDTIHTLRQLDEPVHVGAGELMGLVTVPSLHTALGVLMIVVGWRTWVFLPALAYGTVMIAATPIWGGHYLFDLIAGTAMAIGVVVLLEKSPIATRAPGHGTTAEV